MAIDAVKRVRTVVDGRVEVDVKRYARVEKIPGGEMEDCMVRYRERERDRGTEIRCIHTERYVNRE